MLNDIAVWLSAAVGLSASVFLVVAAIVTFRRFLKRRGRARA
ncbi:MAG: hypothetical protein ACREK6_17655 [Candidatus Rokuibacteriota bacterium]